MKRLNFFSGMNVSLFDMTFSSAETANAITERIADLYNPGVVTGLTVFASGTRDGYAAATPGTAYDDLGERIRVLTLQDLIGYGAGRLNDLVAIYTIIARYVQGNDGTSGLDTDGTSNFRHLIDSFSVRALRQGVDSLASTDVRLARIETTVVGGSLIIDTGVRDVLSATLSGAQTISGSLTVGGCLTVSGRIDAVSDIRTQGDFVALTAGKGLIVTSPDGSRMARVMLDNNGFLAVETLNYTL